MKRKVRPQVLSGTTYLLKNIPTSSASLVDVRVTINESNNEIFEIFAECRDPSLFEWLTSINRIASMSMQFGVPITDIVNCLDDIHSTVTCHSVPGIGMCSSLPTRIGQILKTHYLKD